MCPNKVKVQERDPTRARTVNKNNVKQVNFQSHVDLQVDLCPSVGSSAALMVMNLVVVVWGVLKPPNCHFPLAHTTHWVHAMNEPQSFKLTHVC